MSRISRTFFETLERDVCKIYQLVFRILKRIFIFVFRKHIEVHGRPTPAVFRSSPEAGGRSDYLLTWSVDSYSPIEEYRLLYRQIQPYHKVGKERKPTVGKIMFCRGCFFQVATAFKVRLFKPCVLMACCSTQDNAISPSHGGKSAVNPLPSLRLPWWVVHAVDVL